MYCMRLLTALFHGHFQRGHIKIMRIYSVSVKYPLVALCAAVLIGLGGSAWSNNNMDDAPSAAKIDSKLRAELDAKILAIKSDRSLYLAAMEEGRARTVLCGTCHGKDGKSVKEEVPNLAGQNATYIIDQFKRFSDGRRKNYMMSSLASTFNDEDMLKIAIYYDSLPVQFSEGGSESMIPQGRSLFQERCTRCHGEDGRGNEGYASLAGQRPDYVVKMLLEFKNQDGKRINPWMSGVALRLDNTQMESIATYLANLK